MNPNECLATVISPLRLILPETILDKGWIAFENGTITDFGSGSPPSANHSSAVSAYFSPLDSSTRTGMALTDLIFSTPPPKRFRQLSTTTSRKAPPRSAPRSQPLPTNVSAQFLTCGARFKVRRRHDSPGPSGGAASRYDQSRRARSETSPFSYGHRYRMARQQRLPHRTDDRCA